jgi:hypothetical protein
MNKQEYETLSEEQPLQAKQFSHSVKLEETQKGVRIHLHVYADTVEHARQQLLKLYFGVHTDLIQHNIPRAPMSVAANGGSKD